MIFNISPSLHEGMIVYPNNPPFKREYVKSMKQGNRSNLSKIECGSHTGSHVDAPLHMISDGKSLSEIPLDIWVGPTRVISLMDTSVISSDLLKAFSLEGVTRLLIKTKNSKLMNSKSFVTDYAYLDSSAAEYLVSIGTRLIGFDYLSIERYSSEKLSAHLPLLQNDIVILEGIDLSLVESGDYFLFCGPINIQDGEGAPARVFLLDNDEVLSWVNVSY